MIVTEQQSFHSGLIRFHEEKNCYEQTRDR